MDNTLTETDKSPWTFSLSVKAGVLALQGAVEEHLDAFDLAFRMVGVEGSTVEVRTASQLDSVDLLAMPGGESTTISRLIDKNSLRAPLRRRWNDGMPMLGTCAGAIMLAKEGDGQVTKTGTRLLGFLDARIDRNAFGRQRESFERTLAIDGYDEPFPGIFIRAPAIVRVWGACKPMAMLDGAIVMVRQGNVLATAFHPELSGDARIHAEVVRMAVKSVVCGDMKRNAKQPGHRPASKGIKGR